MGKENPAEKFNKTVMNDWATFKVNVSKEKIVYTKYSLASEKVSYM